jgi:septal ring factor EnvC (AmiA/AmiB activator)
MMFTAASLAASALALATGSATAQQSMADALADVQVYNCSLAAGAQDLFVFRIAADGAVTLSNAPDSQVRETENGLSVMSADGLREIEDGAYYVYNGGTAESGSCTDITSFARLLFPAMTAAFAPGAADGSVTEQAAAASLVDQSVRSTQAETMLTEITAERDTLRRLSEDQSDEIAELTRELEEVTSNLAFVTEDRDALEADLAALSAETDNAEELQAELEELRTLHASVTSVATDSQGQMGDLQAKLDATTATNRQLVATVAGLNGRISELGAALRSARADRDAARADRDAALRKASSTAAAKPKVVTVSNSSLTNAAIARIAAIQGRSQNAIRNELCRVIGRGGGC